MKKKMWIVLGGLMIASSAAASVTSPVRLGVNVAYLGSEGYYSFLTDTYNGVSGGRGWLGASLGLLIRLSDRLALEPKFEVYANTLQAENGYSSTDYHNTLRVPALALHDYVYQHGRLELSLNGQIAKPIVSLGEPHISGTGGDIGGAFSIGMRFKKKVDIQLGYAYYPVKVTRQMFTDSLGNPIFAVPSAVTSYAPYSPVSQSKTYNFGGAFLSVGYYF